MMGIITSNAIITNPVAILSLGTVFGATSVYYFLRMRRKPDLSTAVPFEAFADRKEEYRLIIAVRNDLKMQKGKVAAQCGHAAVAAYAKALRNSPKVLSRWRQYGEAKITVKIESEQELFDLEKKAKEIGVFASIVRDAGQTQVTPGTRTVIAIGPAPKSVLDTITGHLKLY